MEVFPAEHQEARVVHRDDVGRPWLLVNDGHLAEEAAFSQHREDHLSTVLCDQHHLHLSRGHQIQGVARVIIGTAAVRDPALVRDAAKKFPGRVAVGLDARDGKVAVEGWAETSQVTVLEIARRFEDAGVAAIIFTDIARDGLLKGLNLDATIELAERISIPVIASGGFASIEDVKALLAPRAGRLAGAIAGRALYDGRLDPAAALALIRSARAA